MSNWKEDAMIDSKSKYCKDTDQDELDRHLMRDRDIEEKDREAMMMRVDAARQGLTRGNWESLTRPRGRSSDWILLGPLLLSSVVTISLSSFSRPGFLATALVTFNRSRVDGPRWPAGRGIRSRLLSSVCTGYATSECIERDARAINACALPAGLSCVATCRASHCQGLHWSRANRYK